MKKKVIIILVVLLFVMIIPIPQKLKDGGSIEYNAILYQVTKIHKLNENSSTGYKDGWRIKILGIQVYGETNVYIEVPETKWNIEDKTNDKIENSNVSLSIKDGTLKNTGATFILKNNSDKNYQYGLAWELEKKEDEKWYKSDVVLNFNSPALSLNANESEEVEVNWKNSYGKLAKGTYRLVKLMDYENEEGNFESFYAIAEFTIK